MRQPSLPLPTERQREGRTYSHCTRSAFSDILFFSKLFPLLRASFSKHIRVWQRTYEMPHRTSPLEPLLFSFSYDVGERLRLILALRDIPLSMTVMLPSEFSIISVELETYAPSSDMEKPVSIRTVTNNAGATIYRNSRIVLYQIIVRFRCLISNDD